MTTVVRVFCVGVLSGLAAGGLMLALMAWLWGYL